MSFYRIIKFSITFECRTTEYKEGEDDNRLIAVDQSEPIPVTEQTIEFSSKEEAYNLTGDLDKWAENVANTYAQDYAHIRCPGPTIYASDWAGHIDYFKEGYFINDKFITEEQLRTEIEEYNKEQEQIRLKNQQKKEKADKKKKAKLEKLQKEREKLPKPEPQIVPVTIDEEPTTITIKKELTTMDVIQISRLSKSISKLEKQNEEQKKYLNITLGAIERIEESERFDLLLGQTVTRDRWLDEISRTEAKIQKQKDAIEEIKLGG